MKKLPPTYSEPKIFNNQYIIKNQVSSGSFGIVYLAYDKYSREELAIKCEKESKQDIGTLDREIFLLKKLAGVSGVPSMKWYGFEQNYNVIVMELLGKDLGSYIKQYKKLSLKTGLQLADQLIQVMQSIHEKGVTHRDLKPENILMGKNDDNHKCYIVDFGVSKLLIDNGKHAPFRDNKSFIGTIRYASLAAHKGFEIGRKDDLESLFFVIIYSILGYWKLPWQNIQNIGNKDRTEVVGEIKLKTEISEICANLPDQFQTCLKQMKKLNQNLLRYLQELKFESEPNYDFLRKTLSEVATEKNIVYDGVFEWTKIKPNNIQIDSQKKISAPQSPSKVKDQVMWAINEQGQRNSFLQVPDMQKGVYSASNTSGNQQNYFLCLKGSFSSMQIKYIPSQIQEDKLIQNQDQKEGQLLKIVSSQPQVNMMETIPGFKDEIEENLDNEVTLDQKYQQLQVHQVNAQAYKILYFVNRSFKEKKEKNKKSQSQLVLFHKKINF